MHEKLKQSEIDFICALHDPICIKESLYPENIKACHTWLEEDCKLYRVRNYQRVWQPYNWLLCDDRSLKAEANFKKKKLAGFCMNLGARDIGKCEFIDNYCQLANGELVQFKDLIGQEKKFFH